MRLQLQDSGLIPIVLASKAHKAGKARRSQRRSAKKARQHERQDKRMIRLKGKTAAQKAHQAKKLRRINNDIDTPDDGAMPMPGGGGEDQDFSPEPQDDSTDAGYTDPASDGTDGAYQDPYSEDDGMQDNYSLSAGIYETIFKGAKGAGKGVVNEFKKSQTKPESHMEITSANKKSEGKEVEMTSETKMIFSGVGGAVAGFLIAKLLK